MTITESALSVGLSTPETDVLGALQNHFPDVVLEAWDALNGRIFHKSSPDQQIGGFLLVRAFGVDIAGSVARSLEIDGSYRPFDESVISEIGKRAYENEAGPKDAAIIVHGSAMLYSRTVDRILCS